MLHKKHVIASVLDQLFRSGLSNLWSLLLTTSPGLRKRLRRVINGGATQDRYGSAQT